MSTDRVLAIVASMAALEEWLARDDGAERSFSVEQSDANPELRWSASALVYVYGALTSGAGCDCHGKTMADALAQLAQVVKSDPDLLSLRVVDESVSAAGDLLLCPKELHS